MSETITMNGQTALVTGATRGIGAAIALALAARGMKVTGTATSAAGAEKISAALAAFDGCRGVVLDVCDAAASEALMADIVKENGALHVLVNNAGITRDNLAMRMKDEEWDAVLDTNLKAAWRLARAAIRPMMKQRYGRIVSISSVVGASGNPGQANYVAPGFIDTDMTAALPDAQRQALAAQIPLGHLGKPEDIAAAVAYLASPEAGYVTGVQLHVNGGMYMA